MIHVTKHAVQRYQERVASVSEADAKASILSHLSALEIAARFGAPVVRTSEGMRIVLDGFSVVTVLGRGMRSGARLAA